MSKRRSARTAQLQPHPQPAHSDYETDQPDITSTITTAPPVQRSTDELNLKALRRQCDPSITNIIDKAAFTVIYTFSPASQHWDKLGVEGTLFLCSHADEAHHSVVILNRKRLDTFSVDLSKVTEVEPVDEMVMLNVENDEGELVVYGLWIFSQEEGQEEPTKDRMARSIHDCVTQWRGFQGQEQEQFEGNGYDHQYEQEGEQVQGYGIDGTSQMQQQMGEEQAVAHQAGQRVDLMQLFGTTSGNNDRSVAQSNGYHGRDPSNDYTHVQPSLASPMRAFDQPPQFGTSAANEIYMRGPPPQGIRDAPPLQPPFQPPPQQQQQQVPQQAYNRQPLPQQNALLDLFRSAG